MQEEVILDLMELYFVPELWRQVRKKCEEQCIFDEPDQVEEDIYTWIYDMKPETFRIEDREHALTKHSGDKHLSRKIKWVLRFCAYHGFIDIEIDPSNLEWICTPSPWFVEDWKPSFETQNPA